MATPCSSRRAPTTGARAFTADAPQIIVPPASRSASGRRTPSGAAHGMRHEERARHARRRDHPEDEQLGRAEDLRLELEPHEDDREAQDPLPREAEAGGVAVGLAVLAGRRETHEAAERTDVGDDCPEHEREQDVGQERRRRQDAREADGHGAEDQRERDPGEVAAGGEPLRTRHEAGRSVAGDYGPALVARIALWSRAMSSESYHEPLELLSEETRNMHRAIVSLCEELEAVDWYNQRAEACSDEELRAVITHNKNEEIEHAMMNLEWIRRHQPVFAANIAKYLNSSGPITAVEAARPPAREPPQPSAAGGVGLGIGSLRGSK